MTQQITLIKDKILSDNYFTLHNITYDLTRKDGEVIRHKREVYDRGNGATILLYNAKKKTVVLIRQFRVATWVNGNESGLLGQLRRLRRGARTEITVRSHEEIPQRRKPGNGLSALRNPFVPGHGCGRQRKSVIFDRSSDVSGFAAA